MSLDLDTVYRLLPAVYRTRDKAAADAQGLEDGPLEALLAVIVEQVAGLEDDIEQLYEDQFIETSADWVVPYIGDLVGHRPLDPALQALVGSGRAEVANAIRFRRRKGTAAVLEELALNVTGWDAAVVELFGHLATTQYLNHIRPRHEGCVEVRRADHAQATESPFEPSSHSLDVRRIATRRGRYNIPNVGIFLWRVGARRSTDSPAFRIDGRRLTFDPLGADVPLYQAARRVEEVTHLSGALDVPQPIARRALRSQLEKLYGPGRSFSIHVGDQLLDASEVEACDLSDVGGGAWAHTGQTKVAVDPVLGRIMLPQDSADPVRVTYHYGASAAIGGGEYDRPATAQGGDEQEDPDGVADVPGEFADLTAALADLGGAGTVRIAGNDVRAEAPAIVAATGKRLVVRATGGTRPVLALGGDLVVGGGDSSEVVLDGLLLAGGRIVVPAQVNGTPNRLQRLRIAHCTLMPAAQSLVVSAPDVRVEVERCVLGGVELREEASAAFADSIVDALAPDAVAYAGPGGGTGGPLALTGCTLVGKLHAAELEASDAILHARLGPGDTWSAPVLVDRRQRGYVRYSSVPWEAQVPRRYACSPAAAADVHAAAPRFASLRYGNPRYALLHPATPQQLRCGASDGGEMGAFHHVGAPQRLAALGTRLDEFMRFGLEAGLIVET